MATKSAAPSSQRPQKKPAAAKPSDPLAAALEHFQDVKEKAPGKYVARCLAHEDTKASLALTLTDAGRGRQRLLAHCFAGCTKKDDAKATAAFLKAHGLDGWKALTFTATKIPSSPVKNGVNGHRVVERVGTAIPVEAVAAAHAALLATADAIGFGAMTSGYQRLAARGFTRKTITTARLGQAGRAATIPYFLDGRPTYMKMRRSQPDVKGKPQKTMWLEPRENAPPFHLYNVDELSAAPDDTVPIVCEGEYDALSFKQLELPGYVAVSLPSGTGTATQSCVVEPLRRFAHVVLALDNDRAGNAAAKELSAALGASKCRRLTFDDHKDANDALQALGDDALRTLVLKQLAEPSVEAAPAEDDDAESRTVDVPVGGISNVSPATIVNTLVPMFEGRFVTYSGGIYERGPRGICRRILQPLDEVDAVLRVVGPAGYRLPAEAIEKVFRSAVVYAERGLTDVIRGVRFDDDPGDCLARIALPSKGEWNAWKEFTSRLRAPNAFMGFVWSIYEHRHGGRQLCWLRGDGGDGKSVVANVLGASLKGAAGVLDDDRLSGPGRRFAIESVWDKRFVSIPDTKNAKLPMNGVIHQLTGLDSMLVEPKGGRPYTARPSVRILATSNEKPRITRSRSNLSRLLVIEVDSLVNVESDPTWEPRLIAQLPAFLAACRDVYAEVCPKHGDIALDPAAREALDFAVDEDSLEHMASQIAVRNPKGAVTATALYERAYGTFPQMNDNRWGDLKRFLRESWGVKEGHGRAPGDKRLRIYKGILLLGGRGASF